MTIDSCYEQLGGNYQEVLGRIPSVALIQRFLAQFLEDPSFDELNTAMIKGDRANAFIAAHTLKGVCANLGFETLRSNSSELTEALRPALDTIPQLAYKLWENVQNSYQNTIATISEFFADK